MTTTFTPEYFDVISRHASRPFISGIARSVTTTDGKSVPTASTSSRPFAARPTTSKRGSSRLPIRSSIAASSSAITTRLRSFSAGRFEPDTLRRRPADLNPFRLESNRPPKGQLEMATLRAARHKADTYSVVRLRIQSLQCVRIHFRLKRTLLKCNGQDRLVNHSLLESQRHVRQQ